MNKTELMTNVTRTIKRTGFKIKKYSPEILIVAGVIGTVTSAVMACKATTKVSEILDKAKEDIDSVKECREKSNNNDLPENEVYTEEDSKKDLTIIYAQTGVKFAKLYAPSVILGALSLTAIISSHNILRKRNVALAAAYMTVDKSFKDYRGRVAERFGTDAEREIRYNIKAKDIEETVVDEKGKEKTVKTTVETVEDPNQISAWSRIWQEGNPGWTKDAQHNKYFLTQIQNQANDMLRSRGHLFLNEVYDMLGYPRIKEGNIIGWIYDEKNPVGDNFVDFGIYPLNGTIDQAKINFINGDERSILLDFNVDGPILDLI